MEKIRRNVGKEQFAGCIIGQCVGDACGFPVEGCHGGYCEAYFALLDAGKIDKIELGKFKFGQYTDDSQLARELMSTFVSCKRFDPEDYARRIAEIFLHGKIVGRGIATDKAAARLNAGIGWKESGEPAPSAGNGTAMRAAPVGLMFYDDPANLIECSCQQSFITHQDPRCSAGSVAIAGAVALGLENEKIDVPFFLERLSLWVANVDPSFASSLARLEDFVSLSPSEAVGPISQEGLEPKYRDGWPGRSPFVVSSVLWSLYAFLRSPEDYWQAVRTAVVVGGDVDTTGAMTGAISGAHLGLSAIPATFKERVIDQGSWGIHDLTELAYRCFELKNAGKKES